MIQLLMCALVTSLACVGGIFAVGKLNADKPAGEKDETAHYETAKTRMLSVPVILDGEVRGYVVARFDFVADASVLKAKGVPAESIVADEAFKVIYTQARADYKLSRKTDIDIVVKGIAQGVKSRLGQSAVKDVLVDTWNYVNKKDANPHERPQP